MRCFGEPIRLLLAYVGVDYEDVRYEVGAPPLYDQSSWLAARDRLSLAFPTLPYWIDEQAGLRLTHAPAILRHLAAQHGLAGETEAQRALAHSAHEAVCEWMRAFVGVTCAEGEQPAFEQRKAAYAERALPEQLASFAAALRASPQEMWLASTRAPTYADFALAECLDQHLIFEPRCLDAPHLGVLRTYLHRFEQLPAIAAYRRSHYFQVEPLHHRGSFFHRGWTGITSAASDEPDIKGAVNCGHAPRRDLFAMCLLLACLLLLVFFARAIIGFNEVEAAIEEDIEALGGGEGPLSCMSQSGLGKQLCDNCCCNGTSQ